MLIPTYLASEVMLSIESPGVNPGQASIVGGVISWPIHGSSHFDTEAHTWTIDSLTQAPIGPDISFQNLTWEWNSNPSLVPFNTTIDLDPLTLQGKFPIRFEPLSLGQLRVGNQVSPPMMEDFTLAVTCTDDFSLPCRGNISPYPQKMLAFGYHVIVSASFGLSYPPANPIPEPLISSLLFCTLLCLALIRRLSWSK